MHHDPRPAHLSNQDLLAEVKRLAANERQATASLIAALAELDARRLYLGEGASSVFVYCTRVLHLSEYAAYARIEAAADRPQVPDRPRAAGGWRAHADDGRGAGATPDAGQS